MPSPAFQFNAADSASALAHFQSKLHFETDCWDVHASLANGVADFVLLDVRSPDLYQRGHLPHAQNLPHGKIVASKMQAFAPDTRFVVYCAGPHCNGADKAAARLAALGLPVKLMIGGVTGWLDEGFALETPGAAAESA